MVKSDVLLKRLDDIGVSLSRRDAALALIGLGSAGLELDRLDEYSDLDFFVIVKEGNKNQFLEELGWLEEVGPIGYYFFNTLDGCKLLFDDGVFCEFAVFDETELKAAVFTTGRMIWKAEGVSDEIAISHRVLPQDAPHSIEWLIGEALTNLYVGLSRQKRGETLSAFKFIQGYAVDRVLELIERTNNTTPINRDPFTIERRFEQRYPAAQIYLPSFMQGYEKNQDSAFAILSFLESNFDINPAIKSAVMALIDK